MKLCVWDRVNEDVVRCWKELRLFVVLCTKTANLYNISKYKLKINPSNDTFSHDIIQLWQHRL